MGRDNTPRDLGRAWSHRDDFFVECLIMAWTATKGLCGATIALDALAWHLFCLLMRSRAN